MAESSRWGLGKRRARFDAVAGQVTAAVKSAGSLVVAALAVACVALAVACGALAVALRGRAAHA
jgi:hypothetical protein